jgi:hypothetical protein
MEYGIEDLGNFTIVFKFRPIALKEEIVEKILKIQYDAQETIMKKKKF